MPPSPSLPLSWGRTPQRRTRQAATNLHSCPSRMPGPCALVPLLASSAALTWSTLAAARVPPGPQAAALGAPDVFPAVAPALPLLQAQRPGLGPLAAPRWWLQAQPGPCTPHVAPLQHAWELLRPSR